MAAEDLGFYMFGPHKVYKEEVFYTTDLCFVMVNLRPVLPGHILNVEFRIVLVCPKRIVKRFADLTPEEVSDIWLTTHKVAGKLELHYKGTSSPLQFRCIGVRRVKVDGKWQHQWLIEWSSNEEMPATWESREEIIQCFPFFTP